MTDTIEIQPVRDAQARAEVAAMVWEMFDLMAERYPEMHAEIRTYIADQDVAGQLADFDSFFTPPAGECLLARLNGAAVGIVKIRPHGEQACELNRMFVRATARGHGIGRALCVAVIDEARALGYRTIFLEALARHVEALPLYRSLGFTQWADPASAMHANPMVVPMRLDLA